MARVADMRADNIHAGHLVRFQPFHQVGRHPALPKRFFFGADVAGGRHAIFLRPIADGFGKRFQKKLRGNRAEIAAHDGRVVVNFMQQMWQIIAQIVAGDFRKFCFQNRTPRKLMRKLRLIGKRAAQGFSQMFFIAARILPVRRFDKILARFINTSR